MHHAHILRNILLGIVHFCKAVFHICPHLSNQLLGHVFGKCWNVKNGMGHSTARLLRENIQRIKIVGNMYEAQTNFNRFKKSTVSFTGLHYS